MGSRRKDDRQNNLRPESGKLITGETEKWVMVIRRANIKSE
jgi:hypothetical protein